jgi:hypothetical protein
MQLLLQTTTIHSHAFTPPRRGLRVWRLVLNTWTAAIAGLSTLDVCHAGHGHDPHSKTVEATSDARFQPLELGKFRIRAYYPVEAQKSTVQFVLYATVTKERVADSRQLVDSHRHKLRDQIITATRMAPLSLFDEPELSSFRRRLLVRLRRALPELVVDDIYVSDFQLAVKSL